MGKHEDLSIDAQHPGKKLGVVRVPSERYRQEDPELAGQLASPTTALGQHETLSPKIRWKMIDT